MFSTIIPSYNRADLIGDTLDSVLNQQSADQQVIVADNGSTDGTLEVLKRYGDRIEVVQQQGLPPGGAGPGGGRNLGASRATGEYLAFLDSDDLWLPWTLATYQEAIERHGRPAVLAAPKFEFSHPSPPALPDRQPFTSIAYPDFLLSPRPWCVPSAMAVRADYFRQVGGFVQADCEDTDFWLRIGTAPGFVMIQSPLCLAYRVHPGGLSKVTNVRAFGVTRLIDAERRGSYPGGASRARHRAEYICQHIRPTCLFCLERGMVGHALKLYRRTFAWHVRQRRIKFLAALPLLAARTALRGLSDRRATQSPS